MNWHRPKICFWVFSLVLSVSISCDDKMPETRDCSLILTALTSAPFHFTERDEFEVEISVLACAEELDSLPEKGRPMMQLLLDQIVGSTSNIAALCSDDLGVRIQVAINAESGWELAKEVKVTNITWGEHVE